jgi:hypothetical protein
MCADALANLGCMIGPTMIFYEACPAQVSNFFIADKSGVSFSRVIAVSFFFLGLGPLNYQKKKIFVRKKVEKYTA